MAARWRYCIAGPEKTARIFFVGTACATVHRAARAAYFTAGVSTKRQPKSEADAKWYVKCTFESAIVLVGFGHISRPLRGSMAWPGRKGRRAGLCDIMPPGRYFLPLPSGSGRPKGTVCSFRPTAACTLAAAACQGWGGREHGPLTQCGPVGPLRGFAASSPWYEAVGRARRSGSRTFTNPLPRGS
jgi:hypothetical protein